MMTMCLSIIRVLAALLNYECATSVSQASWSPQMVNAAGQEVTHLAFCSRLPSAHLQVEYSW